MDARGTKSKGETKDVAKDSRERQQAGGDGMCPGQQHITERIGK